MLALAQRNEGRMIDDGDDLLVRRREIPPFPFDDLRHILLLTLDGYATDTSAKPTAMSTHRVFDGVRWGPIFESSKFGPVATALSRAFATHAARHHTSWKHFEVFMGVELGLVRHPDTKGLMRWVLWSSARSDALMPVAEAAVIFGLSTQTVHVYLSQARSAITDEWTYLHSRVEQ